MAGMNMSISYETRLCEVDGKYGYFHTWEHYSKPLPASPLVGGEPAGVFGKVFRVDPTEIKFADEEHSLLAHFDKCKEEQQV